VGLQHSTIPAHLAQASLEVAFQNAHRLTFGTVFERQNWRFISLSKTYNYIVIMVADTSGRDCGFESSRRHEHLSLLSVVCCQVELSASG